MSAAPVIPVAAATKSQRPIAAAGFWADAWRRFRRKPPAMIALVYVVLMFVVAFAAPLIIGTKPVVCKYNGRIYFPFVGYWHPRLENSVFARDRFRIPFAKSLREKDPESWAIYPLIYQDPARRVSQEEVDSVRPPLQIAATPVNQEKGESPQEAVAEIKKSDTKKLDEQKEEPAERKSEPPPIVDPFANDPFGVGGVPERKTDPTLMEPATPTDPTLLDPTRPDPSMLEPKEQKGGVDDGPPSWYHWMGVENSTAVDVMAKMIHGTKIALLIGFVTTGIAAVIGITLGALAGYLGGWVDIIISRITEVFMCVPVLILIIALLAVLDKPSIWQIMFVLGLTTWTSISRLTRGEFLRLRNSEYIIAARAMGAGLPRILFRHILPNALAPILVPVTFGIASAILTESGLSLLGIGAPPDTPSWGQLLNRGRENFETHWWLVFFPGLAIFLTVLAYNLIGEGLQEATDPRLREDTK
ncbi:MAG: ABC transporter permease [Planctomycetales bacterium]|nr:ABC transporter permease [Planctomycetales bacterium]